MRPLALLLLLLASCTTDKPSDGPDLPSRTVTVQYMLTSSGSKPAWADDFGQLYAERGVITQVGDRLRTDTIEHVLTDFGFTSVDGFSNYGDQVTFNGWTIRFFDDYSVSCVGPTWAGFFPAPISTP